MALRALQSTASGTGPVGGSGTIDTIPRWTAASTLGDSLLSQSGAIVTNSGTFRTADGNNTEPAYTFSNSSGSGMYRGASGTVLRFASSGSFAFGVSTSQNVLIGGSATTTPSARLQVVGIANNNAAYFIGSTTVGQSFGAFIEAGTNASDRSFAIYNSGATSPYLFVRGDGNVGIGTASPISPLHVKGNATNTDGILTLTPNTGGRNHQVQSLQASSLFRIFDQSAGASRLEIDINGNISAATTGGTFNASTSGAGLKLPATPGNADAQTLDCYQENYASNSWTPVIFGGTTAGTATYSVQEGFYTRWGNLIFCTATVVFSGHTGTGNLSLSGLPFAAKTAGSGTYRSSIIIEEGGGVKAILRLQSGTTATTTGVSIAASGNYVITFVYATN